MKNEWHSAWYMEHAHYDPKLGDLVLHIWLDHSPLHVLGITVSGGGGCPKLHDGSQVSRRLLKTEGRFAVRRSEDASEGFRKKPKVSTSYRRLLEAEGQSVARSSPGTTEGPRKRTKVGR